MKRMTMAAIASFALISCASYPETSLATNSSGYANAIAQGKPTVLVMGEDWGEDTIPRNSRVFNRVLDALEQQLVREGFAVVNETMATGDAFVQGRVRRTDAELYDIAKSVTSPPVDVVVSFKIYPRFEQLSYSTKVNALLTGKALSVSKNQLIDNFEVRLPQDANAPKDCDRECAIEVMGKHARILGQDLGNALALKVNRYMTTRATGATGSAAAVTGTSEKVVSRAYVLEFNNFSTDDRTKIEEYLAAFQGYEHHRIVREGPTNAEYWYETSSDDARFKRNLRRMMEYIGVQAQVSCVNTKCVMEKL